jgi:hypothetical protein
MRSIGALAGIGEDGDCGMVMAFSLDVAKDNE